MEIKNYTNGNLTAMVTKYDYQNSGVYLGNIEYLKVSTKYPVGNSFTLSAWGVQNNDKLSVGYGIVKIRRVNQQDQATNGHEIKYYNVNNPLNPEHVFAPQPYCVYANSSVCYSSSPNTSFYYLDRSGNGPMPKKDLDGKLYKHEIFNATNSLVNQVQYYYRQAGLRNRFFSIKAEDNYLGHQNQLTFNQAPSSCIGCNDIGQGPTTGPMNWRRWVVSLEPAISFYTVLDSVIETRASENGNSITTKQAFSYNNFYQQEFATTYTSDGAQNIAYIKTPLSFLPYPPVPSNGEGDALSIRNLINMHDWDLPIEQLKLKRLSTGDTVVVGGKYNVYNDSSLLTSVYRIETAAPIQFRTQFIPTYYLHNYPTLPSYNIAKDSKYKLQESAQYTAGNYLKDLSEKKGIQAMIWDEQNNTILANCIGAISNDIAFTSFETGAKGTWSYTGPKISDFQSPTGSYAYSLLSGAISKTGLNPSKTYVVSYWSKSGSQAVNGVSGTSGRTILQYTFYEHKVQNPLDGNISLSGSGTIDDLRLYPEKSLMTSYTHKPLIGISSQTDQNNNIVYYEYDALKRLSLVRDIDKNILKKICYNYTGQPIDCAPPCDPNVPVWQNTTEVRCQTNGCSTTGYQEVKQVNVSPCAPPGQIQWVATYNPSSCPVTNLVQVTYQSATAGYTATYTAGGGQTYSFVVPMGSGVLGCVPSGSYTLSINRTGIGVEMFFGSGCHTVSGTSAVFTIKNLALCSQVIIDWGYY